MGTTLVITNQTYQDVSWRCRVTGIRYDGNAGKYKAIALWRSKTGFQKHDVESDTFDGIKTAAIAALMPS